MPRRQPLRVSDAFGLSDSEDEGVIPKDAKLSNNRGSSTGVTMNVNGTVRSKKYANHSLFQGHTSVYGGFMHHEKVLEQQPQAESTEGMSSILGSRESEGDSSSERGDRPSTTKRKNASLSNQRDDEVTPNKKTMRRRSSSPSKTQENGRPTQVQQPTQFICHLCARKFKSAAHLLKHEQLSTLHRNNLLKKKEEEAELTVASS
ncbi:hypothetical protein Pmar_PMAR011799 [Perkinsus marinus ATCC 50983]|uniref:C2H2-type domain-containing protein n=1 Tax=Perkinsus marinus (strain ATCC 50983 / TXsc) TaxID=423536 RepID=C5LCR8_PERM5|nr:hypothetical protein Pmar_PMAR011799 [Perkinsus marinus ATCC 50983]EER05751.1 hypothetical protein Pmar_PMAR011799 [Perkinsus marinus ATCC 50983]|eukprot:XP_002773935.1 hypothetical protein Pmar_PMAR011799 [Perkinsus marinus ATCC 50983]